MSHIEEVNPEQVEEMIKKSQKVTIIDVREDEEVAQGMIPNARHIPLGNVPSEIDDLSKEEDYIMVCRSGSRSLNAAEFMKEKGFNNIKNMTGGMLQWNGELVF